MKDTSIKTTAGEEFTVEQHGELARMIYVRFGRNYPTAHAAWKRLMQNNCTLQEFIGLFAMAPPGLVVQETRRVVLDAGFVKLYYGPYDNETVRLDCSRSEHLDTRIADLVTNLVCHCCWFEVTPLSDGVWEIVKKNEPPSLADLLGEVGIGTS